MAAINVRATDVEQVGNALLFRNTAEGAPHPGGNIGYRAEAGQPGVGPILKETLFEAASKVQLICLDGCYEEVNIV